jgi:hypothetical protein
MRSVLILGLSISLAGCPLSVYDLNTLPKSEPLGEPVLFNRPGPLLHEPSGIEFAERYDDFQRVTADRYDTAGLHVSIGYNDRGPDCVIVATFYVYPTPRMSFIGTSPSVVESVERGWLDREFARSKAGVEQYHSKLESPVVGSCATPATGGDLQGYSFKFRESGNVSELRLFVHRHQWFLKYRFTYPESCEADAERRLEALTRKLPWAATRHAGAAGRSPGQRVRSLVN